MLIKGIHHISMKCGTKEELDQAKHFYTGILGLSIHREWPNGVMLDTSNGLIEIFCTGEGERVKGAIRHVAFLTDHVDELCGRIKRAGYEICAGPKDTVINASPLYPVRIAFCIGPLGEEIELFCER